MAMRHHSSLRHVGLETEVSWMAAEITSH